MIARKLSKLLHELLVTAVFLIFLTYCSAATAVPPIDSILHQSGAGLPTHWGTNTAYYTLNPDVITNSANPVPLDRALHSLPILIISANPADLFAPTNGIYSHPANRGWERPVSIELIQTNGDSLLNFPCGLRIHGGSSRDPDESPKHSFTLHFRDRYNSPSTPFPLLESNTTAKTLLLRAGYNNSWIHPDYPQRKRADYIRDEWMRRTLSEMGYPSPRGIYVHLFLNNLYWGIYNLHHPPDALQLPVLDAQKGDKIESGDQLVWNKMFDLAESGLTDPARYDQIQTCLDLTQFTDFIILHLYAGMADWDHANNWFAARPHTDCGKYRFYVWDAERTLENPNASTIDFDDKQCPPRLFHSLCENTSYRAFFAHRAARLLAPSGPLGPAANHARYQALVTVLEPAIPLEAARWGAYRRDIHPWRSGPFEACTPDAFWRPAVNHVLDDFFPVRSQIITQQFSERGLWIK